MTLSESGIAHPSRSKYLSGQELTVRERLHADSAVSLPEEYEARVRRGLLGPTSRKG